MVVVSAVGLGAPGPACGQATQSQASAGQGVEDASASRSHPPQPSDSDVRAARDLFVQAEKEEDDGDWQSALEKLHRVAEIRLTAGVRYHMALCQENLGLLATALASYQEAENQARQEEARDVMRLVGKQVAALSARVPRLSVHVAPDVVGTVVTLDGSPLAADSLGELIPVEPGAHELQATAPGRIPAKAILTMHEHDSTVVELKLDAVKPAATPGPSPPSGPTRVSAPTAPLPGALPAPSQHDRVAAMLWTTASLALAAGGAAAYVMADRAVDNGVAECRGQISTGADPCSPERFAIRAWDATAAATWTGAVVAGAIAVVLWATPERKTASELSVRLMTGPTSIRAEGRF